MTLNDLQKDMLNKMISWIIENSYTRNRSSNKHYKSDTQNSELILCKEKRNKKITIYKDLYSGNICCNETKNDSIVRDSKLEFLKESIKELEMSIEFITIIQFIEEILIDYNLQKCNNTKAYEIDMSKYYYLLKERQKIAEYIYT